MLEQTIYVTTDAGKDATHTGISGVQRPEYVRIKKIDELAELLLVSSPQRAHGTHEEQDVLIRADPGTGKTWSIRQLALLLARKLKESKEPVPLVPLLVPVQRLAIHMRKASPEERKGDLICLFIKKEFSGDEVKLLLQERCAGRCTPKPPTV